jgi:lipid-binding SYLF domain-containing protein
MKSFAVAATGVMLLLVTGASADIRPGEVARLHAAAQVVQDIRGTVPHLYADRSRCVAVIPDLKKAAFIFGGEYGKGVMSCRSGDGWSAPVFLKLAKGSWGFQAGAEIVDLAMLVMNERGVQKLLENKVTLGADASVAAGPVGVQGQVATDAFMTAEILSYSRAQGLFAGVDISGGVLRPDEEANHDVYGPGASPRTILASRAISAPVEANALLSALASFSPGVNSTDARTRTKTDSDPSLVVAPSPATTAQASAQGVMDADIRARIAAMQQTLERLLADAVQSPVGTTGAAANTPASSVTVTVDRARLLQLRQQLDALLAAFDRRQQ